MGSLTFIGIGLNDSGKDLTVSGSSLIKNSDKVYLETYTTPGNKKIDLEIKKLNLKFYRISRELIEDGKEILEESKNKNIVLLVLGDSMIATTHNDLRMRAIKCGIPTRIIHNANIITSSFVETGLHTYKIGKIVTMTLDTFSSISAVYNTIHANLLLGLHTLILLEFNEEQNKGVKPNLVLKTLLDSENDFKQNIINKKSFAIILSRIGRKDQKIIGEILMNLMKKDVGDNPHAIIFPSKLHFTEQEALKTLNIYSKPTEGNRAKRLSENMIKKYIPNTKRALELARNQIGTQHKFDQLFNNIECYISDSERFYNEGKDELAILSIGYAEGLLDALRMIGELKIEW